MTNREAPGQPYECPDHPQKLIVPKSYLVSEKAVELSEVARQLRLLSGLYDQAARSATSF